MEKTLLWIETSVWGQYYVSTSLIPRLWSGNETKRIPILLLYTTFNALHKQHESPTPLAVAATLPTVAKMESLICIIWPRAPVEKELPHIMHQSTFQFTRCIHSDSRKWFLKLRQPHSMFWGKREESTMPTVAGNQTRARASVLSVELQPPSRILNQSLCTAQVVLICSEVF